MRGNESKDQRTQKSVITLANQHTYPRTNAQQRCPVGRGKNGEQMNKSFITSRKYSKYPSFENSRLVDPAAY